MHEKIFLLLFFIIIFIATIIFCTASLVIRYIFDQKNIHKLRFNTKIMLT